MPRQDRSLTRFKCLGPFPALPLTALSADLTFTAADATNFEECTIQGGELLLAWNTGATGYTVTISSAADQFNRSGDIATYAIAAGVISCFGPFSLPGWAQAGGYLYYQASNAAVKFAIVKPV
jgi:hypothetical protein